MPENPERKQPRRSVLMTAGLTASASVIAASLMGAQARPDDDVAHSVSSAAYADPVVEDRAGDVRDEAQ